jgi:hypothetical protein
MGHAKADFQGVRGVAGSNGKIPVSNQTEVRNDVAAVFIPNALCEPGVDRIAGETVAAQRARVECREESVLLGRLAPMA